MERIMSTALVTKCTPPGGAEVQKTAEELLKSRMLTAARSINCEFREGMLFLRGEVDSYYRKQLAQECAFQIQGIDQVANHLHVTRTA